MSKRTLDLLILAIGATLILVGLAAQGLWLWGLFQFVLQAGLIFWLWSWGKRHPE